MRAIRIDNTVVDARLIESLSLDREVATIDTATGAYKISPVTQEEFDIAVRQFLEYLDNRK